jgi:hypothetical protein
MAAQAASAMSQASRDANYDWFSNYHWVHPKFKMRPFAKKARQAVLEGYLQFDRFCKGDDEALNELVQMIVGERQRKRDYEEASYEARNRLAELAGMNVVDLMRLVVRT